jgi:undecaprenyl-diphosphatase
MNRIVAWVRRRLEPRSLRGLPLTAALAGVVLCLTLLGERTEDVLERHVSYDPAVTGFAVSHRFGALTEVMRAITWLGSPAILVPLIVAIGATFLIRRRDARPGIALFAAFVGAMLLSDLGKAVVDRARPPHRLSLVSAGGTAFPSGHATQAMAVYAMVAILASLGATRRRQLLAWSGAGAVVLLVGVSRIYLGVHWLSDVVAGYALGGLWVSILAAAAVLWTTRSRRPARSPIGSRPEHRPA